MLVTKDISNQGTGAHKRCLLCLLALVASGLVMLYGFGNLLVSKQIVQNIASPDEYNILRNSKVRPVSVNKLNSTNRAIQIGLSKNYFNQAEWDVHNGSKLVDTKKCRIPDFKISLSLPGSLRLERDRTYTLQCNGMHFNLTYLRDDLIIFNAHLLEGMGYELERVSCCYREIHRSRVGSSNNSTFSDNIVHYSDRCFPVSLATGTRPNARFIKIQCIATGGDFGYKEVIYENFHAVPLLFDDLVSSPLRERLKFWKECKAMNYMVNPEDAKKGNMCKNAGNFGPPPNILLIGLDSTSRLNFRRFMNRTLNFLQDTLQAVEMLAYNKVGDNTFPNFVPLMTSLSASELRKICFPHRWTPQDSCPYIWKNFSDQNYLTAHLEDAPGIAILNYAKAGFSQSPVDIYLRPFMLALYKDISKNNRDSCVFQRPEEIVFKYIRGLATAAQREGIPYFITSWLSDLSHSDTDEIRLADDLLSGTLLTMYNQGLLDNTLLFLMSDHGYRFKSIRRSFRGWYEDKLPLLWVYAPPTVSHWRKPLMHNARKLITPFNVHQALVDVLYIFSSDYERESNQGEISKDTSLFKFIPDRTCDEASIPRQYCTCTSPLPYDTNHTLILMGAQAIVNHVNEIISSPCKPLKVGKVITSGIWSTNPSTALEATPSWTSNISESTHVDIFIIGLITVPAGFHLEGWLEYNRSLSHFTNVSYLARLDEIGHNSQSILDCGNGTIFQYYEYCFCGESRRVQRTGCRSPQV